MVMVLRLAVFENAKIFFLETGDEIAVLGGGDHVQGNNRHFDGDRGTRVLRLLLWRSRFGRNRGCRVGLRRRRALRAFRGLRRCRGREKQSKCGNCGQT